METRCNDKDSARTHVGCKKKKEKEKERLGSKGEAARGTLLGVQRQDLSRNVSV